MSPWSGEIDVAINGWNISVTLESGRAKCPFAQSIDAILWSQSAIAAAAGRPQPPPVNSAALTIFYDVSRPVAASRRPQTQAISC